MKDFEIEGDAELTPALEAFRGLPAREAPAGVLVSLLEKQAAHRRTSRSGRARAAVAVGLVALLVGFWAGRLWPESPGPPERIAAPSELPEPPRIPFAAA